MDHESYVTKVVYLVGYNTPAPQPVRDLIGRLKAQGYSAFGAAQQVRKFLDINEMSSD